MRSSGLMTMTRKAVLPAECKYKSDGSGVKGQCQLDSVIVGMCVCACLAPSYLLRATV